MIALLIILAILSALFFGLPLLMLEARRRASRAHRPCAGELWSQDSAQLLYIDEVDAAGVHVLAIDRESRAVMRWTDTWDEWLARCRAHVVLFTGSTGSLNPWEAMVT